jgi:hypothetical protein
MAEPKKREKEDEDEITIAKSIVDEIIKETEDEDADCDKEITNEEISGKDRY